MKFSFLFTNVSTDFKDLAMRRTTLRAINHSTFAWVISPRRALPCAIDAALSGLVGEMLGVRSTLSCVSQLLVFSF
jgi:hypothetical protein